MDNLEAKKVDINWNSDLPIYASEAFLKSISDEYGWIGGISKSGELRCVLPYIVIRKMRIRLARFVVETIPLDRELNLNEEKSLLNSTVEYFRSAGVDIIIPATTNTIFSTYPDGAIAAPYGSHIIDLTQPEETLWRNLNKTYRKKIRNSIKNGVEILEGFNYLHIAHELIRDTLKRSSHGFMSINKFEHLIHKLAGNIKIFVAVNNGKVQGCTIFPFSNHSAYSLYGGRIYNAEKGAMNLLNWEAIRRFRELGVERFNFMGVRINPESGSKQEGIMTFKERFGGQLIQGYMWKYSLNPFKYSIYSLAARMLRGGDIVAQEGHKLKAWEDSLK